MIREKFVSALDLAAASLVEGNVRSSFNIFGPGLNSLYFESKDCVFDPVSLVRNHTAFNFVMEDPYSRRAFEKPRKYAGDAVMLDYIYRGIDPQTSDMGKIVFKGTGLGPMGQSVTYRKKLLESYINQAVSTTENCSILSVASGHCREVEGSLLSDQHYSRGVSFYALDQDRESLQTVAVDYKTYPIETISASVKSLFNPSDSPISEKKFDLIYSAGLFDYLDDFAASFLTGILASHLNIDGKLLIGNFSKNSFGIGFMELFLDWKLKYRNHQDLVNLLPSDGSQYTARTFEDPHGNVIYIEITRQVH